MNFDIVNPIPGDSYDIDFANFPTPVQLITETSFPNPLPNVDFVISNGNIEIDLDTQNPTIDCPADITINSNGAPNVIVNNIAPTVSDNCGTPIVTYSLSSPTGGTGNNDASGTSFNVGETTVTYTATDAAGNTVDCSFNVTVVQETLSITCPSNILTSNDSGQCGATLMNLELTINSSASNIAGITYSINGCLLYTSPSPRDRTRSRMPSSA